MSCTTVGYSKLIVSGEVTDLFCIQQCVTIPESNVECTTSFTDHISSFVATNVPLTDTLNPN